MIIKIPLDIVELDNNSFHVFVSGRINGCPCDFIVDTGASKTVFALNYLLQVLDKPPVSNPDIQSAGISASHLESHVGQIEDFSMGELRLCKMEALFIDLSSISELYRTVSDKSIWGLIGSDFLLKYKAKLDYGSQTLSLRVPKSILTKI